MSYEAKLQSIMKFIPPAVDRLFQEYSEAALSWNRETVITALIAKIKLDLPEINSESEAFNVLEGALGSLIQSGKIQAKAFGYSPLGAEEVRALLSKGAVAVEIAPLTDDFSDVIEIYNGPTEELNRRMKTESFRTRFNQAVAAGKI